MYVLLMYKNMPKIKSFRFEKIFSPNARKYGPEKL